MYSSFLFILWRLFALCFEEVAGQEGSTNLCSSVCVLLWLEGLRADLMSRWCIVAGRVNSLNSTDSVTSKQQQQKKNKAWFLAEGSFHLAWKVVKLPNFYPLGGFY